MKFKGGEFSTGTMRNFQSELTLRFHSRQYTSFAIYCAPTVHQSWILALRSR